jgi:hypothetical protein
MEHPLYGQGHFYCGNCRHAVRAGAWGCGTCRTPLAELMLLDEFMGDSYDGPSIGFDPFDGQVVINQGDGIGFEPGTGQLDYRIPGTDIDFPL